MQSLSLSIAYVAMRFRTLIAVSLMLLPLLVSGQTIELKGGKPEAGKPPPAATAKPTPPAPTADVAYRPILLGQGPNSLVNRIDAKALLKGGQKDGLIMFNALIDKTGKMVVSAFYRQSPDSTLLEQEVKRRLRDTVFVPGIYNHKPVDAVYYGTVSFVVVDGKQPRLRIFSSQEYPELKAESDFIGPQPILGGESGFNGVHYPPAAAAQVPVKGIADIRVQLDDKGELQSLSVVGEHPPLVGFGAQALMDLYAAKFIPAFRDGKPVACDITLPLYYPEPE